MGAQISFNISSKRLNILVKLKVVKFNLIRVAHVKSLTVLHHAIESSPFLPDLDAAVFLRTLVPVQIVKNWEALIVCRLLGKFGFILEKFLNP